MIVKEGSRPQDGQRLFRCCAALWMLAVGWGVGAEAGASETPRCWWRPSENCEPGLPSPHKVRVQPLMDGSRVTFVSLETAEAPRGDAPVAWLEFDAPRWLHGESLLGTASAVAPFKVRLSWVAGGGHRRPPAADRVAIVLVHHLGYARVDQRTPSAWERLPKGGDGSSGVTEHGFPEFRGYPPGLYDMVLTVRDGSGAAVALGQVLFGGFCQSGEETLARVRALYPAGVPVFAGGTVLAPGFRLRVSLPADGCSVKRIIVVSSADWLEGLQDGLPVASVSLGRDNPVVATLRLGRDTASGWYDWHARGNIRHARAPVAWSSAVEAEGETFQAHMYRSELELPRTLPHVTEVEVAYRRRTGLLRVAAIVLLP